MRFREAKKLHNGDEVTIKATNEVVEVISAYTETVGENVKVFVDVCSSDCGFTTLSHEEMR